MQGLFRRRQDLAATPSWSDESRRASARTSVFFVHGFGTDEEKTWSKLARLLAADDCLSSLSFIPFRYATARARLRPWIKIPTISEIAKGLATEISIRSRLGQDVLIIAHSMGGLVVRRMLADAMTSNNNLRVKRVLLLATPNSGSVLASVLSASGFANAQGLALAPFSEDLDRLNEDWLKLDVESRFKVELVAAGKDQYVAEGSVRGFPGRQLDAMLIDDDHGSIVAPANREQSSYKLISSFLARDQIPKARGIATTSDPLFENYRPEHEPFYHSREIDDVVSRLINRADLWIYGESGSGKTACAMRLVSLLPSENIHVYLGSYAGQCPRQLLRAVAGELGERLNEAVALSNNDVPELIAAIVKLIAKAKKNEKVTVLIEEIPVSNDREADAFLNYILMVRDTLNSRDIQGVSLIITSISDPTLLPCSARPKTRLAIEMIKFERWKCEDIISLANVISAELQVPVDKEVLDELAKSADGLPRFVKVAFRHHIGVKPTLSMSDAIKTVHSEQAL